MLLTTKQLQARINALQNKGTYQEAIIIGLAEETALESIQASPYTLEQLKRTDSEIILLIGYEDDKKANDFWALIDRTKELTGEALERELKNRNLPLPELG